MNKILNDAFRSKYSRYAVKGGGVALSLYILWHVAFVLIFSFNVNWYGMGKYNAPINHAVVRSLLLGKDSINQPIAARTARKNSEKKCVH